MPLEDLPEYPEARDISLRERDALARIFQELHPQISEYTFTNLYSWRKSKRTLHSRVGDTPIILRQINAATYLMPMLVKVNTNELVERLRRVGARPALYGLLKHEVEALDAAKFHVEPDKDNWDYVYLTKDLIELEGTKYRVKRQNIQQVPLTACVRVRRNPRVEPRCVSSVCRTLVSVPRLLSGYRARRRGCHLGNARSFPRSPGVRRRRLRGRYA